MAKKFTKHPITAASNRALNGNKGNAYALVDYLGWEKPKDFYPASKGYTVAYDFDTREEADSALEQMKSAASALGIALVRAKVTTPYRFEDLYRAYCVVPPKGGVHDLTSDDKEAIETAAFQIHETIASAAEQINPQIDIYPTVYWENHFDKISNNYILLFVQAGWATNVNISKRELKSIISDIIAADKYLSSIVLSITATSVPDRMIEHNCIAVKLDSAKLLETL